MIETNISKILSERTTKVVIMIVLIMLFVQPAFQNDSYVSDPTAADQGIKYLIDIYDNG